MYMFINVNVKVHVYSPDIPMSSVDYTFYTWVLEHTFFYSLICRGELENSVFLHSVAAVANHYNIAFFVTPGIHHCW